MMMKDEVTAKRAVSFKKKKTQSSIKVTDLSLPRTLNHLKPELNAQRDLQQTGIQMRVAKQWP